MTDTPTPIGVVIGALTIPEARAVVDTVDAINAQRLTLRYDDDGVPVLTAGATCDLCGVEPCVGPMAVNVIECTETT